MEWCSESKTRRSQHRAPREKLGVVRARVICDAQPFCDRSRRTLFRNLRGLVPAFLSGALRRMSTSGRRLVFQHRQGSHWHTPLQCEAYNGLIMYSYGSVLHRRARAGDSWRNNDSFLEAHAYWVSPTQDPASPCPASPAHTVRSRECSPCKSRVCQTTLMLVLNMNPIIARERLSESPPTQPSTPQEHLRTPSMHDARRSRMHTLELRMPFVKPVVLVVVIFISFRGVIVNHMWG